tara:strand:+ start:277 stop:504 length:228 start_codon:yes stop_codon:yes gene_type:complete
MNKFYKLTTYSNNQEKIIEKEQLIELELKLNKTVFSNKWSYIGDKLYECYTTDDPGPICVNDIQFAYLINLLENQ